MKRIALLFAIMLLALPVRHVLAWEVSPELEALAAAHFPGAALLDGAYDGGRAALLLESPEGETCLGFCAGDAADGTAPLPDRLFQIAGAYLHADTAMLLVEDYGGTAYFVGCTRTQEGWMTQISTPLPEGTEMLRCVQDPQGAVQLCWTTRSFLGTDQSCSVTLYLQADGRWEVGFLQAYRGYVDFRGGFVRDEERCVHGVPHFPLDVTQVSWQALPTSVEAAAERMELTSWAILAQETPLLDAPGGTPLAQYNPGTHLYILGVEGAWVNVAPGGSVAGGWMQASSLLVGSRQLEADHLAPDDCPVQKLNGDPLEVFLLPADTADPVTNPCLFCFTRPYGYPVYIMGVWENGWTQLYSPDIPGGVGFVRTEQLHAEPSGPLG